MREAKQLDHGIGDTFVSSVVEEVSFASIDFQASSMEKAVCPRQDHVAFDTKV